MTVPAAPDGLIRLLMINDDRKLGRLVADYLGPLGFEVTVILLDVMLPGLDGFEVLQRIRKYRPPVLMLTARGDETDRIVGLEVGADDYLPKTFSTRELLARLRAVLRRSTRALPAETAPAELVVGSLRVNPEARTRETGGATGSPNKPARSSLGALFR